MEARETTVNFLYSQKMQLKVPIWQRRYSWEKPQWEELWEDMLRVRAGETPHHFLGSIVVKQIPGTALPKTATRFWIIDGQQRITSLNLMMAAIRDVLRTKAASDADSKDILTSYTNEYLENPGAQKEYCQRLVLQDTDLKPYAFIVEPEATPPSEVEKTDSLISRAHAYFKANLEALEQDDLESLTSMVLDKFDIVWITLEDSDNAHRVFQTLNNAGRPLRQSDLVRNYFFLLLGHSGEAFYTSTWLPMEKSISLKMLANFFGAWAITRGYPGDTQHLFEYFEKDLRPFEGDPSAIMEYGSVLAENADIYRLIKDPANKELQRWWFKTVRRTRAQRDLIDEMVDLNNWRVDAFEGLLLLLFQWNRDGLVTVDDLTLMLRLVKSFVMRRIAVGYEPNMHKTTLRAVAHRLHDRGKSETSSERVALLKFLLSSTRLSWPDDEEMRRSAPEVPLYTPSRARWTFSLLEVANRQLFKHTENAPEPLNREKYTVEHVMPQTLSKDWRTELGIWGEKNVDQMHSRLVDVIGNLTLTPINSKLAQRTFIKKKTGLMDSTLRLNDSFGVLKSWTSKQIQARGRTLTELLMTGLEPPLSFEDRANSPFASEVAKLEVAATESDEESEISE